MADQSSIDSVTEVLRCLYYGNDATQKEHASKWLEEFQKSIHAWEIADKLLRTNQPLEICYFAAQTMKMKIQTHFHELPAEVHQALRDSLLEHVGRMDANTPTVIVTQLSLALADLAIQMASWTHAIKDLGEKFSSQSSHIPFLLEVMQILPEELNNDSIRVGDNRRQQLQEELQTAAPMVLHFLVHCHEHSGSNTHMQARLFRTLGAWVQVGAVPQDLLIGSPLLTAVFHVLMDKSSVSHLHESAAECICCVLYRAEDLEKFGTLTHHLCQAVGHLGQPYVLAAAEEDVDKCMNYVRIFTELGETLMMSLVDTPTQGLGDFGTMELLLKCAECQHFEVVDVTFNFWNGLSEVLYDKNSEELNALFVPYIRRLICQLAQHCQMDSEHEGLLPRTDDFSDFRSRVVELVKDTVFIPGSSKVFFELYELLQRPETAASWSGVEGVMYVMVAIARNLLPDIKVVVPEVLTGVLQLPPTTHVALRLTAIRLVGELCEWIDSHSEFLAGSLEYTLTSLHEPLLASAAASTLQKLCEIAGHKLVQHVPQLVSMASALDTIALTREAAVDFVKGTAQIVGALPYETVTEQLQALCEGQTKQLQQILNGSGGKTDPVPYLDRLAAVFRHIKYKTKPGHPDPCLPVVQHMWPVISALCERYLQNPKLLERCCRCIRFAIRAVNSGTSVLLHPVASQLISLYQRGPHSCLLYVGSILVDELGLDPQCTPGLMELLEAMCPPTFALLEGPSNLVNHPDSVDDFFRLCIRFCQRIPGAFFEFALCGAVVDCAIASCSLDHREASASTLKFLEEVANMATTEKKSRSAANNRAEEVVRPRCQTLITALLSACALRLRPYAVADISEVLQALNRGPFAHEFSGWLQVGLSSLPTFGANGNTVGATPEQLQSLHSTLISTKSLSDKRNAIKTFMRLYR